VGEQGGRPPKFSKVPFSGSKVPFASVKNVVQIAFFGAMAFGMSGSEKFVILGKNNDMSGKFCYFGEK
jgi:hypothetical protein